MNVKEKIHHGILVTALIGICCACQEAKDQNLLEPEAFLRELNSDHKSILLDVRKPEEYAEGHLEHAINLDWTNTDSFMQYTIQADTTLTYYIYCKSGIRSHKAASAMKRRGLKTKEMKGGITKWMKNGLPIEKTE